MTPLRTSGLIDTLLIVLLALAVADLPLDHFDCLACPANLERWVAAAATSFNFGNCGLGMAMLPWLELRVGAIIGLIAGTHHMQVPLAPVLARPVVDIFLLRLFGVCRRWIRLRPPAVYV